jgi:hypothetical protein
VVEESRKKTENWIPQGKHFRVRNDRLNAEGQAERARDALAPAQEYGMKLEDFWREKSSNDAKLFLCEVLALRICHDR